MGIQDFFGLTKKPCGEQDKNILWLVVGSSGFKRAMYDLLDCSDSGLGFHLIPALMMDMELIKWVRTLCITTYRVMITLVIVNLLQFTKSIVMVKASVKINKCVLD